MQDFFKLDGDPTEVSNQEEFTSILENQTEIKDVLYRPDKLKSPYENTRFRIKDRHFYNVSFTKTLIERVEFTDCEFENCLFIGTRISDCRFTHCKFIECNVYRIELDNVYIDPKSFRNCIQDKQYSNIGVYLFHELLNNSRRQAQPQFSDHALYHFRRWQRVHRAQAVPSLSLFQKAMHYANAVPRWVFAVPLGYGVRLRNLAISAILSVFVLSMINWAFSNSFGLYDIGLGYKGLLDSLYFSVIVVTTLGFGDITPKTALGRAIVSAEAVMGFIFLATFASMIFRKISQ